MLVGNNLYYLRKLGEFIELEFEENTYDNLDELLREVFQHISSLQQQLKSKISQSGTGSPGTGSPGTGGHGKDDDDDCSRVKQHELQPCSAEKTQSRESLNNIDRGDNDLLGNNLKNGNLDLTNIGGYQTPDGATREDLF